MPRLLLSLTLLSLTTCVASAPSDSGCLWFKIVHTSDQDILTPQTARQIDANNKIWIAQCNY